MKHNNILFICIIIFLLTTFFCGCEEESKSTKNKDSVLIIEEGDCVDFHFIGMYSSNNTVFDSSYEGVDSKTGGSPLKVYIDFNGVRYSENYTSEDMPFGLIEGLIGLKEGETYTIGPIPPKKAYGEKQLSVGDTFYSKNFAVNTFNEKLSLNQTFRVTDLKDDTMSLKWVDLPDSEFTMPHVVLDDLNLLSSQEDMLLIVPPYLLWENCSEIINTTDENVVVKTTPNKSESLYDEFTGVQVGAGQNDIFPVFPDATEASFNDSNITLVSNPDVGDEYPFSYNYFGQIVNQTYIVKNVTDEHIGFSIKTQGLEELYNQTMLRIFRFNRTYNLPRKYEDIPSDYYDRLLIDDLEKQGYGLSNLAGESLIYEVTIVKIDKTSQN